MWSSVARCRVERSATVASSARRWATRRIVYYAEWEWPDMESFKSAARSDEFMATGKDAMELGGKFSVMFAEVD